MPTVTAAVTVNDSFRGFLRRSSLFAQRKAPILEKLAKANLKLASGGDRKSDNYKNQGLSEMTKVDCEKTETTQPQKIEYEKPKIIEPPKPIHVDVEDKILNDKSSPSFGQRGATLESKAIEILSKQAKANQAVYHGNQYSKSALCEFTQSDTLLKQLVKTYKITDNAISLHTQLLLHFRHIVCRFRHTVFIGFG